MSNPITIKYEKFEYVRKEHEMQIEDSHYSFLEGKNRDYNITEYLGVWTKDNALKICEITCQDTIRIKSYTCKGIYTDCTFKHFLESHNDVQEICEDKFKKELNKMLEKLK